MDTNKMVNDLVMNGKNINVHNEGKNVLNSLDTETRSLIRSKCHTLHFVKLLALNSQRADRQVEGGETKVSHKAVGIVLITDEDLEVPDIPSEYDNETGIPSEEIKMKKIPAGSQFFLTYYEFMFLMFRIEFAGFCSRGDDPYGVYFSPKMPKFLNGEKKLPTPTINFLKAGSPKEVMDYVDEYDHNIKTWVVKEEYREKFGSYLSTYTPERDKDIDYPTSTKATIGVANLLKRRYDYDFEKLGITLPSEDKK